VRVIREALALGVRLVDLAGIMGEHSRSGELPHAAVRSLITSRQMAVRRQIAQLQEQEARLQRLMARLDAQVDCPCTENVTP